MKNQRTLNIKLGLMKFILVFSVMFSSLSSQGESINEFSCNEHFDYARPFIKKKLRNKKIRLGAEGIALTLSVCSIAASGGGPLMIIGIGGAVISGGLLCKDIYQFKEIRKQYKINKRVSKISKTAYQYINELKGGDYFTKFLEKNGMAITPEVITKIALKIIDWDLQKDTRLCMTGGKRSEFYFKSRKELILSLQQELFP